MNGKHCNWYSRKVSQRIVEGREQSPTFEGEDVNICQHWSQMKDLHGKWMVETFDELSRTDVVYHGFKKAGLYEMYGF